MALLVDRAGVDAILVGDSVGRVALGMENTMEVTMEDVIRHCRAVTRGAKRAFVIGDNPFLSYQPSTRDAIYNAGLLMKQAGVDAIKVEGGREVAPTVKAIVNAGMPVEGHIGVTPQSASQLGGYKVQGADVATARKMIDDAKALEDAGAFMIIMECIPDRVAEYICSLVSIPCLGFGCGPNVDGQSLNVYDILGLFEKFVPKPVKKYADLQSVIVKAFQEYKEEIEKGIYPGDENTYHIKDDVFNAVLDAVKNKK